MIKIKFNNSTSINEVSFKQISDHIIELGGVTNVPTSGFTTWRMDGITQLGDFSTYTTIYYMLGDIVQLSNDGSTYIIQETPDPGTSTETLMKAQIKALSDRNDFLEDCFAEMAGVVYA